MKNVLNCDRYKNGDAYRNGEGEEDLLSDPESELRLGREKEKKKCQDDRWDGQNKTTSYRPSRSFTCASRSVAWIHVYLATMRSAFTFRPGSHSQPALKNAICKENPRSSAKTNKAPGS